MANAGLQMLGFVLAFIGFVGLIASTSMPEWKASSYAGDNIVTALAIYEGLWMSCASQSTGQIQCKWFDSLLQLSASVQTTRALMILGIFLGFFAILIASLGMKCTTCFADDKQKKSRIATIGGAVFITAVNEIEKALECAWTYLLFHEGDEFITDNIEFYKEALAENNRPQDIRPRQDAERYVRRHQQELKVLLVGSDNLDFVYSEQNYWSTTFGREDINRVPSGTAIGVRSSSPSEKRTLASETDAGLREGGPVPYDEVQMVWGSEALNGSQRVLLDGLLTEQECRDLKSAAQYGYDGRIPLKSAQLFYEVSEKARRTIESYFMLNSTLYFSYTHLVCRTAIQGQQSHRNDLSHPIHADNCLLDTEAYECWKEPPAYTYRDYSAILYLNGDFDGGEFIFTEMDAKTVTASVKPNCGRMVGFSSGGENPHGVKAVTRGQRCAVAMWFTLDPLFRELERLQADEVMQSLDDEHRMDILNPRDEL
ncbi:Prolyl 3-hydroxylase 2 [Acipenser ruthenus]|uniref:procollagen-proline 3-dioxygenase n=1 Tax=Acipenser ruthenus TaxID=7906 RepID=A0A444UHL9_ACIRT|nr:Prolyl 3-hydroxylase 2 [Acipenser ruthenus]